MLTQRHLISISKRFQGSLHIGLVRVMAPKTTEISNTVNTVKDKSNPDVSLVKAFYQLLRSEQLEELKCAQCGTQSAFAIKVRDHPRYAIIDGEIYLPDFKPAPIRPFIPTQSDIFVAGYPKCGNTWTQNICSQLLDYDITDGMYLKSPMPEQFGIDFVNAMPLPRMLKLHYAYDKSLMALNARYVFVARNPKDCIVSGFYHCQRFYSFDWPTGEFDVQFEYFINGLVPYGDYFDHLLSWLPHIQAKNVLFLKYEDMVADLPAAVQKIGEFLGGKAAKYVADPKKLQEIVDNSTLESMKKKQGAFFPAFAMNKHEFVRQGGSRGWKQYFSRVQSDRIDELFRQRLAGTVAQNWWKKEMAWEDDGVDPVRAQPTKKFLSLEEDGN